MLLANAGFGDILITGDWVINSFVLGPDNLTSQFKGMRFQFVGTVVSNANGVSGFGNIVVSDGNHSVSGHWNWLDTSSYYSSGTYHTCTFNFGTQRPYDRLGTLWTITAATASTLTLDSGNPAENGKLILIR